jgi:hypothetical protein
MTNEPKQMSDPDLDEHVVDPDIGLIDFYSSEAEVIVAQYQNIEKLLGQTHDYAGPGTHCEVLLRDFLRRNMPQGICVDKGFVHGRIGAGDASWHCPEIDILIHDNLRFRPIFRVQEFVIVQPEAVLGVIQVKRSLKGNQLKKGIANVALAMRHVVDSAELNGSPWAMGFSLDRKVFSAVVGFDGKPKRAKKIEATIADVHHSADFNTQRYTPPLSVWMLPHFVGSLQGVFAADFIGRRQVLQRRFDFYQSVVDGKNVSLQAMLWLLTDSISKNKGTSVELDKGRFAFPETMKSISNFVFSPNCPTSPAS